MLENLSFFGLVENFNSIKENYTNDDEEEKSNGNGAIIMFIVMCVVILALTIWCIVVLITFKLPQEILILSIVLFLFTGPVIPLILAYVFKDKKIGD